MNRRLLAAMLLVLSACASAPPPPDATALIAQGRYEEAIARLEQAVKDHPADLGRRTELINQRDRILNRLVADATAKRMGGGTEDAAAIYRRVLGIDPGNDRAEAALAELERDRRNAEALREAADVLAAGSPDAALARVQAVLRESPGNRQALELRRQLEEKRARELAQVPSLRAMYDGRPINMAFRDADVRFVFEALSRESDVTFVFERDVRPDLRTTIVARNIAFDDAVDLLLMSNQLEKKIINRRTVLVYPATTEKLRQYQELAVKGFYLTHADVKQTAEMIKAVINPREMFIDEKMSLIVMRDTPEAVAIAEKLVAMHDLVPPEVMLDVEVLEVQRNKLVEMGVQWPNRLALSPLPSSGDVVTLKDLTNITSGTTQASIADMIINLNKETGLVDTLANPRIRSQNRQKASILIGNKVPVVTTTATATGFASQSVQYLDVGLKLEIEPSIHLQDEVEVKLALEVSNIVNQVVIGDVLTYQIGTRNAATTLRMKDGETQVLAGLINDQDTRNAAGIPGLGDIPVVGRLFRSQKDQKDKTEIVLLLTPHLVRNLSLPDATASEFLSGSEVNLRSPRALAVAASPASAPEAQPAASLESSGKPVPLPAPSAAPADKAAAEGSVKFAFSGPASAKVGEQFQVAVSMHADSPLHSVPLQLSFDPAALQVVDVVEGGFFRQGGGKSSFAHRVDAAAGRVTVGAARSDTAGSSGEAPVATITFRVQAPRAKAELRLDSATAITPGGDAATVNLPPPFSLTLAR